MPNKSSVTKRIRYSTTRRLRNRAVKSAIMTCRRGMLESIGRGDVDESREKFRRFCSTLDKAVKKGIVSANFSDRCKSRAAVRIQAMG